MVDGKILTFLLVFRFPSNEMPIAHKIFEQPHFANPFDDQRARFWAVVRAQLLAYRQLKRILASYTFQHITGLSYRPELTFYRTRIFISLVA